MNAGVKVHGLREVNAAFGKIDKKLRAELGNDLKEAAAPVVKETRRIESGRWRGASLGTIRAKRSGLRVFVEQSQKKTTGQHPEFGSLQMREALIPALKDQTPQVFREVDQVLNRYANIAGF